MRKLRFVVPFITVALVLTGCAGSKKEDKVEVQKSAFVEQYMLKGKSLVGDKALDMSVYPDKRFQPNTLNDCAASLDPYNCYLTVTYNLFNSTNTAEVIEKLNSSDLGKNKDCYRISKGIGALITSLTKEDQKLKLLSSNYQSCPPSFVEGVYDQIFGTLTFEQLKDKVTTSCSNLSPEVSWSCHYYLGRALMNNKLGSPEEAAQACMQIPSVDDSKGNHKTVRRSCLSGAWQTFFRNNQVITLLESMKPKARDIFDFCLIGESSSKDVCLQEDSPAFWRIKSFSDLNTIFNSCAKISNDRNEIDQCYFGMGRGVSDSFNRDNSKILNACATLFNEKNSDYCFIAAGEALNNADFVSKMDTYCNLEDLEINKLCSRALGEEAFGQMGGSDTEAIKICQKLSSEVGKTFCITGVLAGKSRVGFVHSTANLDVKSIYAPCSSSPFQEECFAAILSGLDEYYDKISGKALIKNCTTLPKNLVASCLYGVGRAVGIYEKNESEMLNLCSGDKNCLIGLRTTIDKRVEPLKDLKSFCSKLKIECLKRNINNLY